MTIDQSNRAWYSNFLPGLGVILGFLALLLFAASSHGQVTVQTIGGGVRVECSSSSGFLGGNTWTNAQFNSPYACALDSTGDLFVADRNNNALEEITQAGNRASSVTIQFYEYQLLTNAAHKAYFQTNFHSFPGIVGVAVDATNNLYVLTTNSLIELDPYLNFLGGFPLTNFISGRATAIAIANDSNTNIFVSFTNQSGGSILRIPQNSPELFDTVVNNYAFAPSGLALRQDGQLEVADTLNDGIYVVATNNSSTPILVTGGSGPGWADGSPTFAKFDSPHGLVASSDGRIVVCDTLNNRLRIIDTNNNTTTLYGTASNVWMTSCCSCSPAIYAGWVDGTSGMTTTSASGREPSGIALSPSGTLFVTELYYSLIRSATGTGLTPVNLGSANSSTNPPPPPTISPSFGYFPECQTISVTSTVPDVYYTTDGSTPTTNSTQVPLTFMLGSYVGSFQWCNSQADLSQLQIIAADGGLVSTVVTGGSASTNQLGFVRSPVAGVGSTAVIPVVLELESNTVVRSLQYRIEITPTDTTTPPITSIQLLPITPNDFVPLLGPAPGNTPVTFQTFSYGASSNGQGLVVSASGGGSGLSISRFAVAALLAVPIPPSALPGQTYNLNILFPSGTSDGNQAQVHLGTMANQTLTIADVPYLAGDSSPADGYDAGEFGDGVLDNSDVNNALYASVGIRVPFAFSDAYNAMDVYPETPGEIGDGFITYLDWQTILQRSIGLDTNNWIRFWTNGGFLSHQRVSWNPGGDPVPLLKRAKELQLSAPGSIWFCPASIGAGVAANVLPGNECSVPVYAQVSAGYGLSGFQFRATVTGSDGAPVVQSVQFNPAAGIPSPLALAGIGGNDIVRAWALSSFEPPLHNSNYLGTITFQVPADAQAGQSYAIHFSGVGGASDIETACAMESFPGSAWVLSSVQQPPSVTSDEWKIAFFGSLSNSLAADNVDADGDGASNWQEYLAGTNPTNALSKFEFSNTIGMGGVSLSWLTAPGKTYILESQPTWGASNWTPVNTNTGDGNTYQFIQPNYSGTARFYRIRLQP